MKRLKWLSFASLAALAVVGASEVQAQGYRQAPGTPPPRTTPVSPYIRIAGQTGNTAAFSLYRDIRPELEWRNSVQNLQQQLNVTQSAVAAGEQSGKLPGTGHATQFMNLGGYFQGGGAAAQGARQAAGTAPPRSSRSSSSGTRSAATGGRR